MNRHMIRLLALAMILSGTFSSCIKEEKTVPGGQQPIEIGLNEPTRSTPIVNVSAINGQNIGIIALYPQASTTRFNSYATVSGSKATLAAMQYWPTLTAAQSNHKLNFVSWYPYGTSAGGPTTVTGNPSTTEINNEVTMVFTEKTSMADQKDFMVATHTPAWKGAVVLAFHHALTRIRFKFNKEAASDADYTVTGIKLKNVATTSTLTVTSVTATNEGKTPVLKWLDTPTATNEISWTGSFAVSASGSTYNSMAANADDSQNTNSFMTIPMTNLSNVQLELTYTPSGGTSTTVPIPLNTVPGIPSWETAQNIEYAVCIAGTDATLTLSSTVLDWKRPNQGVIFDGQYYLKVDKDEVSIPAAGGTVSFIVETNYHSLNPDQGYNDGIEIDLLGCGSWLSSSYTLNDTTDNWVYELILAAGNGSDTGVIKIQAGNMVKTIKVTRE